MNKLENPDCPCTSDCPRHGKCSEYPHIYKKIGWGRPCQEYHRKHGGKTSCGK